jgi:C-terminal processing protease CtpA/Prc
MRLCLVAAATIATISFAQSSGPRNLNFEEGQPGEVPAGWFSPSPGYAIKLTPNNPKSGSLSCEIAFTGGEKAALSGNLNQAFAGMPYRGKKVRFRAAVKIAPSAPEDFAQIWFRVRRDQTGSYSEKTSPPIHTLEWQYFDVTGDIDSEAQWVNIGLSLHGKGKAWIDDASIEIVGDAPQISSYVIPPSAAFDKLTEAAKLWAFVKYFHTRVTMPGVDWDQAFMDAMPKILESRDDDDFAAGINAMLAPLQDPFTHAVNRAREKPDPRFVPTFRSEAGGVLVVSLATGDGRHVQQARQAIARERGLAKGVVFDLRDSRDPDRAIGGLMPIPSGASTLTTVRRSHYGYAPQIVGGFEGYRSSWQIEDGRRVPETSPVAPLPVFLVNRATRIPYTAAWLQEAGACIIAEDTIDDSQTIMGPQLPVGHLKVWVRVQEYQHADGTGGLTANLVLHKSGDAALEDAIEIARSGHWPKPMERTRFPRIPAAFSEKSYANPYPGTQLRMLAAARVWGVFNYFHPYKYLYGEDWDAVLAEFLPKLAAARDARAYHLGVAEMVAHTHDTHCFVYSRDLSDARGAVPAPIEVRWIENQPVVTRVVDAALARDVHPGDVVTRINGEPASKRIEELSVTIAASTPQSLMGRVMALLLNARSGARPDVTLRGADGREHDVSLANATSDARALYPPRSGEIYRLLSPKIGYVDLERLEEAQVDAMFAMFRGTDAIIMDMRGYPRGTAWSIAPRLATAPGRVRVQVRTNVVTAGAEDDYIRSNLGERFVPVTDKPHYNGKTVLLIDDRAISQSEASGLMFRAANGTVFIGSPTTGANGDVTVFMAPGGIRIPFTGEDIRWPDGKQLQRVGLQPDIEAHPTLEGVRAGRDEILERAVAFIESGR